MVRAQLSQSEDKDEWIKEYESHQYHHSLNELLAYYSKEWKSEFFFDPMQAGFNLVIYTYSAVLTDLYEVPLLRLEQPIFLSTVNSKRYVQSKISQFFSRGNSSNLLILIADTLSDSQLRINLCRSIINNERTQMLQQEG